MTAVHAGGDGQVRSDRPPAGVGPEPDASMTDLLSRLGDDATLLFRQEVELAKVELKREATSAGKAAGMLAAAGILAFVTLMLVAWAAAWGLAEVMAPGLAFLIVGIVVGVVAAILAAVGRKRLKSIDLTPRATLETLQEDRRMLTERRTG